VSGWENGQTPRLALAEKIAEVYRVPVARVLNAMKASAEAAAEVK
jgi:transcriptional regulator with XRE-family HTH domain